MKKKKILGLSWKFFLFHVVLGLRGIIVAPPLIVQSKEFSLKSYYLGITNKEITQIPKSESTKFSFLCTFKPFATVLTKSLGISLGLADPGSLGLWVNAVLEQKLSVFFSLDSAFNLCSKIWIVQDIQGLEDVWLIQGTSWSGTFPRYGENTEDFPMTYSLKDWNVHIGKRCVRTVPLMILIILNNM